MAYDIHDKNLLDGFWRARGVVDASQRNQLVEIAVQAEIDDEGELVEGSALPGVAYTWSMQEHTPQVRLH